MKAYFLYLYLILRPFDNPTRILKVFSLSFLYFSNKTKYKIKPSGLHHLTLLAPGLVWLEILGPSEGKQTRLSSLWFVDKTVDKNEDNAKPGK